MAASTDLPAPLEAKKTEKQKIKIFALACRLLPDISDFMIREQS
jgi:hypothetical protein